MEKISFVVFFLLSLNFLWSQKYEINKDDSEKEDYSAAVYWSGTRSTLTLAELAAYCAPIFWFSPDEPELFNKKGRDIRTPMPFPFEAPADSPVVYYQVREILIPENSISPAWIPDTNHIEKTIVNLNEIKGFQIDYMHYYPHEAGVGRHRHDTEQVQFKIYIKKTPLSSGSSTYRYELFFLQATGTAHMVDWYKNIYSVDTTSFDYKLELPFHILVEEGKHASCTDMNGDGYYTPGYDVNTRVNDAWGVKDVIRTGTLFSSQFQSWMAKVRQPEYRVFPPLPQDSPLRKKYSKDGVYAPDNAVYQLRPMPDINKALPDLKLKKDMESYYVENWPKKTKDTNVHSFLEWWEGGRIIKSLSIALRSNNAWGVSFSFPLLIIKNIEAPIFGGWIVNRIYLQDENLRDFGYNILYTPSASRFLDPYFAFGFEIDRYVVGETNEEKKRTDFVMETGVKFRSTVKPTFLNFLSPLTDFWGFRIGIKNRGFMAIDHITYVLEIGAGAW